jgi:hypothetical protein
MRRRPRLIALIALGVVAFLVVSALLARALSADGAERSAITSLVQAQARGDVAAAQSKVERCGSSPGCRARITSNIASLARPGSVTVLQLETSTGFSLGSTLGTARVAFRIGGSKAIVQCVRVRRAGNVLSGLRIELLSVSGPLKGNASCPGRGTGGP